MRYLSVCSGIEAASAAWHPLGWEPVAFAEIEKFPSAVLAYHYPNVPNLGDMTKFRDWPDAAIDVLVGGTPCQSFSVAGLRKGLADPRGNLCLTFLAVADRYRPQWVLWENVPGVLSSDGGRDFGAFLGGLGQLGYGWSYRVLDAQYVRVDGFGRAVPQRRRRVFVVGHLGDWRRAAAVLFERESLQGNTAPRRQAGQRVAPTISARPTGGGGLGTDFDCDGGLIDYVPDIVPQAMSSKWSKGSSGPAGDEVANLVAHALRADGFDASEDGRGRGTPLIAFSCKDHGADAGAISPTLRSMGHDGSHANAGGQVAVAFQPRFARNGRGAPDTVAAALTSEAGRTGKGDSAQCVAIQERAVCENADAGPDGIGVRDDGASYTLEARTVPQAVQSGWAVRRLTPRECERLQGFPDDYTQVPSRGKPAADGPRYKALGNSMAVNCMRWIGRRIEMIQRLP